ncbi:MAG: glutamate 5-kinase, partial [Anaerolineales bacterium]
MAAPACNRIVVKLGTSTLTGGTPHLAPALIVNLVRQLAALREQGCEVTVVSSGAMAAGRERLGFPDLPKAIPQKQMLAAVGQLRLMTLYDQLFHIYGIEVAQVLLTRRDIVRRRSYLNARGTLLALLSAGVVPVVNENDTVATEEIRVGDNDNLSALIANLIEADLLLLLTDQPGVFTADPRRDNGARLLTEISSAEIPPQLWEAASGGVGGLGTGGMVTKLQAADLARRSGTTTIIARGSDPDVVLRAVGGEPVGTRFTALTSALESRKRFILSGWDGKMRVLVDEGAVQALGRGSSLLPVGITAVEGDFERGATVAVCDRAGREVARGLVNYRAGDVAAILGRHSDEIERVL